MGNKLSFITLMIALLAVGGCGHSVVTKTEGGVILSISEFDGLPVQVSVSGALNAGGIVAIEQITLSNIAKVAVTGNLNTVSIESYEVGFGRGDGGTILPGTVVRGIFGSAAVNGTVDFDNLPVLLADQLSTPPLSDLLPQNGGQDGQTGSDQTVLELRLRFYGHTLGGVAIESNTAVFSVNFVS